MASSVLATNGTALDTAHSPAENAVTASTAAARPPAAAISHCPKRVSATQRRASATAPSALAPAVTTGKKTLPTAIARLVNLLDNSCRAFCVVLLRVSNSACMEPAYLLLSATSSNACERLPMFFSNGAMAPRDS